MEKFDMKNETADYFLLKQKWAVALPKRNASEKLSASTEPTVRIMADTSVLEKFDYLSTDALVSDRLKLLFEQYLWGYDWRPCAFVSLTSQKQQTFWFLPQIAYTPEQIETDSAGIPCSLHIKEADFAQKSPGIFRICSPRNDPFIIVHLSVAESMLRRGICGLELERLYSRS